MATLISLFPPSCSCGVNLGKLQRVYEEEYVRTQDYRGSISKTFGEYNAKMCCLQLILSPHTHIPDAAMDHAFIDTRTVEDGVKTIVVPQSKIVPRLPQLDPPV